MKNTSLYIHIPFCLKKCNYCNFYSFKPDNEIIEKYIDEVIDEIGFYNGNDILIDTIYLGGGTPSIVDISLLHKLTEFIYRNFNCDIKEFTIEVNPCSSGNIRNYKDLGINRLSVGIQSLDDNILKLLGRTHSSKQAIDTLKTCSKYFDNISADFIIGVQQEQTTEKDILEIKDYIKHLSAYILKIEENTPLHSMFQCKQFLPPDDDQTAEQYKSLYNTLKKLDINRYEISNFALNGYESKHNLKYWEMGDYIGVGASSHSFYNGKRYYNKASIKDYLNGYHIKNNKQINEQTDKLFETIMLGLRLEKGIDTHKINKEFNINFATKYQTSLKKIKPYMNFDNNILQIKPEYMLLQNAIAVEFI